MAVPQDSTHKQICVNRVHKMVGLRNQWQVSPHIAVSAIPDLHSVIRDMNMLMATKILLVRAHNLKGWLHLGDGFRLSPIT